MTIAPSVLDCNDKHMKNIPSTAEGSGEAAIHTENADSWRHKLAAILVKKITNIFIPSPAANNGSLLKSKMRQSLSLSVSVKQEIRDDWTLLWLHYTYNIM